MADAKEINGSPIMKMVNTLLRKKFPWVKRITLREDRDPYEYTRLIFIDLEMDPYEFAKDYNVTLKDYVSRWMERGDVNLNSYANLCTLVEGGCPDEIKELERNIEKEMNLPFRSKTVPDHFFDILKGRQFATTSFVMVPTHPTQP